MGVIVLAAVVAVIWACLCASSENQDRGDSIGCKHSRK